MSVSPNTSLEHCRRVQGKAEGTQRRCERALGSWEKMSFWCLKQREKYAETASSCRFFPLLFQPRDELQSCFGSPACPLVSPRLPPPPPSPSRSSGGWRCDSLCHFFISSTLDRLGEEGVNVF